MMREKIITLPKDLNVQNILTQISTLTQISIAKK